MITACPACEARVAMRTWIRMDQEKPLFVETYACGSVHAFGIMDAGLGPIYSCDNAHPAERAEPTPVVRQRRG